MKVLQEVWRTKLNERKKSYTFRRLKAESTNIDFYSNDYLGIAKSPRFEARLLNELAQWPQTVYWVNRVTINQWEYITNRRYRIVYSLKTSSGGSPSFFFGIYG